MRQSSTPCSSRRHCKMHLPNAARSAFRTVRSALFRWTKRALRGRCRQKRLNGVSFPAAEAAWQTPELLGGGRALRTRPALFARPRLPAVRNSVRRARGMARRYYSHATQTADIDEAAISRVRQQWCDAPSSGDCAVLAFFGGAFRRSLWRYVIENH